LRGVDKNDPGDSAPFTHNMTTADAAPYPNLADVPPPPTRATTAAERQKLTQSLVADRAATAAAVAQSPTAPAAAPAPPAKPAPALPAAPPAPAPPVAASVPSPPPAVPGPTAPPIVAAAPNPAAPAKPGPSASPTPAQSGPKLAANNHQSGWRKAGDPPDPVAQDSTLQMPDVRSVPEPEAVRPPPAAPVLPTVPHPAAVPEPTAALAAAAPEPAPPVPAIAPVAPPPAPAKPEPKRTTATVVARLELPASGAPLGRDQAQIDWVASLYGGQSATVRVVGYAAAPATGGDPLQGYRSALDRAQAIAKALAAAGIPAAKIQTEAMPVAGPGGAGRIEIQFVQ